MGRGVKRPKEVVANEQLLGIPGGGRQVFSKELIDSLFAVLEAGITCQQLVAINRLMIAMLELSDRLDPKSFEDRIGHIIRVMDTIR